MTLKKIVKTLCAFPKGILAADEGISTIQKRFDLIGVENTLENRIRYRDLLFSTPGLESYIAGVITYSETFDQVLDDGSFLIDKLLEKNILVGIKLDLGLEDTKDGQKICIKSLDLVDRIKYYVEKGATFAKWRALFIVSKNTPNVENIELNAEILADYAFKCTQNGLVPIVEPEILLEGDFGESRIKEVSTQVLDIVFKKLSDFGVDLQEIILKPSFVRVGLSLQTDPGLTAQNTLEILKKVLPDSLGGIAFISGGIADKEAIETLNILNQIKNNYKFEIPCSYSYGRALQSACLQAWEGNSNNFVSAQLAFTETLKSFKA